MSLLVDDPVRKPEDDRNPPTRSTLGCNRTVSTSSSTVVELNAPPLAASHGARSGRRCVRRSGIKKEAEGRVTAAKPNAPPA